MQYPTYDLTGKVAIVTGGTRGLGYGIAKTLAHYGAAVVVTSRKQADCDKVQAEFESEGHPCLGVATDASIAADRENLVAKAVERFGHIDILVNNAGVGGNEAPIFDITEEDWDKTHSINLKGTYFTAQAVAKQMKEQGTGGRIINTSSAAGIIYPKYASVYGAAKAAVTHMTKIMANEWARYNINVNVIAPGYIETDMTKDVMADEKNSSAVLKKIAFRRFGQLDDVAGVVLFLATDASKYVTGVLIPVDGGLTIG